MTIEATQNEKFGLPKPDFKNIPPQRTLKSIIILILIGIGITGVFIEVGKIMYQMLFTDNKATASTSSKGQPLTSPTQPDKKISSSDIEENSKIENNPLPEEETSKTENSPLPEEAAKDKISPSEDFERPQSIKRKEDVVSVQKQLEKEKKYSKPLVKPGTYQELHRPQGIYHLVVVSHLNKHTAMKSVQQLIKKKLGVFLILPNPNRNEKYYRVTIGHSRTQYEAEEKLKELKKEYPNLFLMKY